MSHNHVIEQYTSRYANQNISTILRNVRNDGMVAAVTYGADSQISAYIIPASMGDELLKDHKNDQEYVIEKVDELLNLETSLTDDSLQDYLASRNEENPY